MERDDFARRAALTFGLPLRFQGQFVEVDGEIDKAAALVEIIGARGGLQMVVGPIPVLFCQSLENPQTVECRTVEGVRDSASKGVDSPLN
jgi:hypothetical protein